MLQKAKGFSTLWWSGVALVSILGSSVITARELNVDAPVLNEPVVPALFHHALFKSVNERLFTTHLTAADIENLSEAQLQTLVQTVLKQHPELNPEQLYDVNGNSESTRMAPYLAKLPEVQSHNLKLLYRYIDYHTIYQLRFGR